MAANRQVKLEKDFRGRSYEEDLEELDIEIDRSKGRIFVKEGTSTTYNVSSAPEKNQAKTYVFEVNFQPDFIKGVRYFCELSETAHGYLVYSGQQAGTFLDTALVPFNQIDKLLEE